MTSNSSVLYQNNSATVLLIDIPTSIELAQELSSRPHPGVFSDATTPPNSSVSRDPHTIKQRHILSSPALETPYPATFEPKSEAARAKVIARIPRSENKIHEDIAPIVCDSLDDIRKNYSQDSQWCHFRYLLEEDGSKDPKQNNGHPAWVAGLGLGQRERGKKRRAEEENISRNGHGHDEEDDKFRPEYLGLRAYQRGPSLATEDQIQPPLVLSPGRNRFEDEAELCNNVVKNTSPEAAIVEIRNLLLFKSVRGFNAEKQGQARVFLLPALSNFILCNLPISAPLTGVEYINPIPSLPPDKKFNLIVFDPPWPNKSVRRSGHYQTQTYLDSELLMEYICSILTVHSYLPFQDENTQENQSIAAIWITNSAKAREAAYGSLTGAGFSICEEWIWVKTTVDGQPVTPIEGVWRKPYEVLVIGKREPGSKGVATGGTILRRVIAAVPDVHSRKPNLREVFERLFFTSKSGTACVQYSALEVFARNLTAGWWACGNEVLKFNSGDWWVDD